MAEVVDGQCQLDVELAHTPLLNHGACIVDQDVDALVGLLNP